MKFGALLLKDQESSLVTGLFVFRIFFALIRALGVWERQCWISRDHHLLTHAHIYSALLPVTCDLQMYVPVCQISKRN